MLKFLCLVLVLAVVGVRAQDWDYHNKNSFAWPFLFPVNCKGDQQSPINIITNYISPSKSLRKINFNNYNQNLSWTVTRDETGITFWAPTSGTVPTISGSDYNENFKLSYVQLHWGANQFHGSEHQINGRYFSLELQFYHKSSKGRVAVTSFLFEAGGVDNSRVKPVLDMINSVDGSSVITNFNSIITYVTGEENRYYRYFGSLTQPPCNQSVAWNIFKRYIPISVNQLSAFYNLTAPEPVFNYRHIQPLNKRKIQLSVDCSNKYDYSTYCTDSSYNKNGNNYGSTYYSGSSESAPGYLSSSYIGGNYNNNKYGSSSSYNGNNNKNYNNGYNGNGGYNNNYQNNGYNGYNGGY